MFNKYFSGEANKRVYEWAVVALILLSVFLFMEAAAVFKKLPNIGKEVYPQSTIAVSGEGEVYALPDVATFNFSVTETGKTVKEAQEKSDAKIQKALAAVRDAGIAEKDIKTTNYNVYPKYEYLNAVCPTKVEIYSSVSYCPPGKQNLVGYEVTQSTSVKVRDTEKAGDLVTKVGAAGVSNISGIEFSVDNRDEFVAKARKEAIKDAKDKAEVLADQLGIRLGKIMYYSENGNYPMYDQAMGKGGAEMSVSAVAPRVAELSTGETKITSNITITYEIR